MIVGRFFAVVVAIVLFAGGIVLTVATSQWWLMLGVPAGLLLFVGIYDLVQTRHSILRNYPILGHFRFCSRNCHGNFVTRPRARARARRNPEALRTCAGRRLSRRPAVKSRC